MTTIQEVGQRNRTYHRPNTEWVIYPNETDGGTDGEKGILRIFNITNSGCNLSLLRFTKFIF